MPDGYADEAREALLAKAAQAWEDDPALDPRTIGDGSGDDSVSGYLRAYYQRVATEDLAAPSRLAAVAEAHARLGLSRPQGRARVQVRAPADAQLHPVGRSGLVVDIVTDDMPYLVDSVTTELNRHEAEIRLLVHPLLRVHRDVTGALRGILGVCGDVSSDTPGEPAAGEITESWIHVELGPPRDKVTGRSARGRPASRAGRRAGGRRGPAADGGGGPQTGRPARRGARQRRGRARRPAPLAGGRQFPLPRLPRIRHRADRGGHGPARRDRHRARHPPPRPAGAGGRAQDVLSGAGPGARPGRTAGAGQGELPVHRLPGQLPGLRLGQEARPGRPGRPARHRRVQVPRPVLARRAHRAHRRRARTPAQAGSGPGDGRAVRGQPRRAGAGGDPRGLPARGAVRDLGGGAHSDRSRRAAAERAQADQAVPAPGPVRTVYVLPGVPAQGPVHHQGQAARAGHLAGGAARSIGGLQRHRRRLGPGPPVRGGQGRAGPVRAAGGRGRPGAEAGRGGQVVG